jgi:ComF family protein
MTFLSRLLRHSIQTLPFECALCQRWPSRAFEGVSGVCQSCIQKHAPTYPNAPKFPIPNGLDECIAAVNFEAPWSALIARYKFAPEPGLARLFAGLLLRDERIRTMLNQVDTVIPLPLAPERLEERGFNQALALAKHLCKDAKRTDIDSSSLMRTRDTLPQRTLGREARQHNVANAFALAPNTSAAFQGKHILLIDDVITTGATLVAAAQPLRRAGAASVSAVVIARTPLH